MSFKDLKIAVLLGCAGISVAPVGLAADQKVDQSQLASVDSVAAAARPDLPVPACVRELSNATATSDYSVFLAADCPVEVQRRALRNLWKQLPILSEAMPWG